MRNYKIIALVTSIFISIIVSFTVPHLVSGEIHDGKVELNNGLVHHEKMYEEYQFLAPSQIVTSKEIKIKNTGSLSLKMYEKFHFSLKKFNISSRKLDEMLNKYYIRADLSKNGEKLIIEDITENWISAKDFNTIFNNEKKIGMLNPNDTLTLILHVKLDENAGNEYQGVLLNIDFVAGGIFTISDDGLILPDTSTSFFNKILIGIMLISVGIATFYVYKRRVCDVRK